MRARDSSLADAVMSGGIDPVKAISSSGDREREIRSGKGDFSAEIDDF